WQLAGDKVCKSWSIGWQAVESGMLVNDDMYPSIPASAASMAWTRLRARALCVELCRERATTATVRNSRTIETSRAVTIAIPRSSRHLMNMDPPSSLVRWDVRTDVVRISVFGVTARDRLLELDGLAVHWVLVHHQRHHNDPIAFGRVWVEREARLDRCIGWIGLVDDVIGHDPPRGDVVVRP